MIMEKKIYCTPFMEIEQIELQGTVLSGSSPDPHPVPPIGPGLAPARPGASTMYSES